ATRISVGVSRTGTEPVSTADGCAVRFLANVELPSEVAVAQAAGAEGIGLVRTEYLLGTRAVESFDEEAQYLVYRDLVEGMAPHPVTVRTFDVDESQASARLHGETDAWHAPVSSGPLGLRAIRLSLNRRDLFATQLRALVRAARCGPLRILFPFVSSVEELREAKAALRLAQDQVAATGEPVPPIPVGVMIEVPSAALTADLLADEADFFSIGTNDLIQYCLAVDRRDERVAGIFEPLHPAILRIVRQVTRVANRRHRGVAVCGEMAADPGSLLLLLGLGVTEYSMSPGLIAAARDIVRQVGLADLRRLAAKALRMGTAAEIHALVRREFPAFAALPEHRGGQLDKEDEG
ncbi:MAG: hypothetical protein NTY02_10790, partial [Acidobacteria bacterium]|nr:hypothetical protein [Acidobacteriota bacterium]